jgi:hypothetical protein
MWSNVYHAEAKGAGCEDERHGFQKAGFTFTCLAGGCVAPMWCCYFLNLFSFGCLPDGDERFYSRFYASHFFLEPKATHERGGAVLCCAVFSGGCITFSASVFFFCFDNGWSFFQSMTVGQSFFLL